MTSRETTNLLTHVDHGVTQSLADKLFVGAYALIQWPWLLKSLSGGRKADKDRLLDRLGLSRETLPNLGSWKADTALLTHIVDTIEAQEPKQVVELGCGASSLVIARALQLYGGGQLTSFDQHGDFVAATQRWLAEHGLDAELRHAPLVEAPEGWPGYWYDLSHLPASIDLLVIDGPPWTIHPHVRGAAETLFDRIAPGGVVLLDDAARPGERVIAKRWRKLWPQFDFALDTGGTKGTLIGRRVR